MMRNLVRPFGLALWLAIFTLAASPAGAAIPAAENLLPSDTFILLTAPDCATLRKSTGQSPELLFWNDPAMRAFHDRFVAKWKEFFVGPIGDDLGLDLGTLADLPQGQFTLAVTRNGWNGIDDSKTPGLVLLLDAREKSALLATNLAQLKKKWADKGKAIRKETVHGIDFSLVPLSTNDIPSAISALFPQSQPEQTLGQAPKPAKPLQIAVAQYQSLLVVGSSLEAVEPVAARLTGGSVPCLADNSQFLQDKASQFRDSPIYYIWANTHSLFEIISHLPTPEPNPNSPSLVPPMAPAAVLQACGLMGLKSVSVSYSTTQEGSSTTCFLSAPEASREGLLKIMAVPAKDSRPPAFVSSDTAKFWRWRLDGQKTWAQIQKSLAMISPQFGASVGAGIGMINGMAQQKEPGFDLNKYFFENLGDDLLSYQKAPSPGSAPDLKDSDGIFMFAASNPDQALVAIKTTMGIYSPRAATAEPQEFLGHKIYPLPLGAKAGAAGAAPAMYCATGSGYVVMSSELSMVQEYLRSAAKPPEPLSRIPGFADAVQHVGGMDSGLFGFQDNRVEMRTLFSVSKHAESGTPLFAMLPKPFSDMLDVSTLPDFDRVSKYFYFTVFSGSTTPEGISFKFFYPRPPQLN